MLNKAYKFVYMRMSNLVLNHKVTAFSETVILAASGYLVIKKALGFSISGWLLNNALQQPAVNAYVFISAIILILAILLKAFSLVFQHFPAIKHATVEPEEISACLQVMNKEISNHIIKCNEEETPYLRKVMEQHSFDVNTRLTTDSLAEHIRKSISSIGVKRKDIFISLYTFDEEKNTLKYELHHDPRRDIVKSKIIHLDDKMFCTYECVKCMNTETITSYVIDKSKYAKGHSKRHKTMEQYMGCKLECNGFTYGFLNIEFHNNSIFLDEDEMRDFMEENIFPFKLLLEYQYLKKDFFQKFQEYEKHWKVA